MRPLYDWEIEIKEDNEKLKKEFVSSYSSKLNLNNRFITPFERIDIKEEYDLKNELLDEIIDESNEAYIKKNEPIFLNQFINELNSCDKFIDDKSRVDFHYKYTTDYNDYYESLKLDKYIDDHNNEIFESQKEILYEFEQDLNKFTRPIFNEDIKKFKTKYNKNGHDYFNELGMYDLIKKFNDKFYKKQFDKAFNILIEKYGPCNSPIPDSELNYLESQYPEFYWEGIIEQYNKDYFIKKSQSNLSENDVYFLTEYIRRDDWDIVNSHKVKISKEILNYKKGVPYVVIEYTDRIIKFIEFFANYGLERNYDKIFLISIPSSTKKRNANSSMKKSIDIIENKYRKGLLKFKRGREREIINCNDLLIRSEDVNPAHLSHKRPTYKDHIRTISFNENINIDLSNGVFFLLDDITTSGIIMNACTDILVKNGIERNEVYKFAIAKTASNY